MSLDHSSLTKPWKCYSQIDMSEMDFFRMKLLGNLKHVHWNQSVIYFEEIRKQTWSIMRLLFQVRNKDTCIRTMKRKRTKVRDIIIWNKNKDMEMLGIWKDVKIADGYTQLQNGQQGYTPGEEANRVDWMLDGWHQWIPRRYMMRRARDRSRWKSDEEAFRM